MTPGCRLGSERDRIRIGAHGYPAVMRTIPSLLAAAALALAAFASDQGPAPTLESKEIPADLAADVKRVELVGREIHANDAASARATDALAAKLGDLEHVGLGGWLTERERDAKNQPLESWLVLFVSADKTPRVLLRVRVTAGDKSPELLATAEPQPLSDAQKLLWTARQLAIEAAGPYEQPMNPVVLAGADIGAEDIYVYLMAGTEKPDTAVLGRHVRVRVAKDATKVLEVAPLSKSVIELATKLPDGKDVVALTVTHVLTEHPSEAHVFASLLYGKQIFVTTKRGVWSIAAGKVRYMGEMQKKEPPKSEGGGR